MERPVRKLSRVALLVWLILPLVIVALLWLSIDRTQGRADPERWRRVPAGPGVGGDNPPRADSADQAPTDR